MIPKTTIRRIAFNYPFVLPNMPKAHAAGSFDLVIDEVPLDVSWEAHRTSCRLMVIDGATTRAISVTMGDIEAALLADKQHDAKTGFS